MALPASYTETTLAAYMHAALGQIAAALSYANTLAEYQEAVNDALELYGVSDVAQATDISKLRACARLCAWTKAASGVAYDFSADGASFSRSQIMAQIQAQLAEAGLSAAQYVDVAGLTVEAQAVTYSDPYTDIPETLA